MVLLFYQNLWDILLASLELFSDHFMDERQQPTIQERCALFGQSAAIENWAEI